MCQARIGPIERSALLRVHFLGISHTSILLREAGAGLAAGYRLDRIVVVVVVVVAGAVEMGIESGLEGEGILGFGVGT